MESRCCLNFIGVELENPFGRDDNDLPLEHFQVAFVKQHPFANGFLESQRPKEPRS